MSDTAAAPQGQGAQQASVADIEAQALERAMGLLGGEPPKEEKPAEVAAEQAPAEVKPVPAQAAPVESKLAERIRLDREERAKRQAREAEERSFKQELEQARAEIQALKSAPAPEDDIIGYARARKWDRERQAHYGQMLLYDLVPDKADANVRMDLFRSEQRLKERQAEERAAQEREAQEKARQEALAAEGRAQLQAYEGMLDASVRTFEPGVYPESQDWFGDDHRSYTQSLLATANNLAEAARNAGQAVDLSPGNVAKVLEQELANRQRLRDERRGKRTPPRQEPAPPVAAKQGRDGTPIDPSTLTENGKPRPPAASEEERLRRAMDVAFGGRV